MLNISRKGAKAQRKVKIKCMTHDGYWASRPAGVPFLYCAAVVSLIAVLMSACAPTPPRAADTPKVDPTAEAWYGPAVEELAALNREAERLFREGRQDAAAASITKGQPLANRLLAAPYPTLAAMEAASDLDDLYGRMLLANGNVGWARMQFQKNAVRWRAWKPATAESLRRLKQAEASIAECDRRLGG
jgi:hypothetical protein